MRAMLRPESKIPDLMCELMSQASAPLRYRTCNITGKMVEWTAAYREIFKTWAELEMLDRVPLAPGDGYEFVRPGEKAEEFDQYWDLTEQRWKYSINYRSFTGKVGSGSQLVGPHRRRRNFVPTSRIMDIIVHLSQQEHVIVKQLARKQELSVSQVMIQGLRLYQASVHSTDNLPKKMEVESSAAGESAPIKTPEVPQEHGLANPATPTAAVGASAPDADYRYFPDEFAKRVHAVHSAAVDKTDLPVESPVSEEHRYAIGDTVRGSLLWGDGSLQDCKILKLDAGISRDAFIVETPDGHKSIMLLQSIHGHTPQQPAESPDDWVTQDRVPDRPGIDQWRRVSDNYTGQWVVSADGYESYMHGHVCEKYNSVFEVRCRRRDLPVVPDKSKTELPDVSGEIRGLRYALEWIEAKRAGNPNLKAAAWEMLNEMQVHYEAAVARLQDGESINSTSQIDVPAESPDDWVTQDRVASRPGIDEERWTDRLGLWTSKWVPAEGCTLYHGDNARTDYNIQLRCRRRDLPVMPVGQDDVLELTDLPDSVKTALNEVIERKLSESGTQPDKPKTRTVTLREYSYVTGVRYWTSAEVADTSLVEERTCEVEVPE